MENKPEIRLDNDLQDIENTFNQRVVADIDICTTPLADHILPVTRLIDAKEDSITYECVSTEIYLNPTSLFQRLTIGNYLIKYIIRFIAT